MVVHHLLYNKTLEMIVLIVHQKDIRNNCFCAIFFVSVELLFSVINAAQLYILFIDVLCLNSTYSKAFILIFLSVFHSLFT